MLRTAVEVETSLEGSVDGQTFSWAGSATLLVTPKNPPELVTYQLNKVPKPIVDYANRLVRDFVPGSVDLGAITVNAGVPFVADRGSSTDSLLHRLTLPATVAVTSSECRFPPLTVNIRLFTGKLEVAGGDALLGTLTDCAARGLAATLLPQFDDCAQPFGMLGFGMIEPQVDQRTETGCTLTLRVGGTSGITLSPVRVDTTRNPYSIDFNDVDVLEARAYADAVLREIDAFLALGHVRIDNPRFVKDTLTFNAALFGLPVVGEVDLGPMSVTLAGDFSAATSPTVVLRNALLGALFPLVKGRLVAAAAAIVPSNASMRPYLGLNAGGSCREVSQVTVNDIGAVSGLCAYVDGDIPVYGNVKVPYRVNVWPRLDLKPQITQAAINALTDEINKLVGDRFKKGIQLPNVKISDPRVVIGPDWNVGLRLKATLDLPYLGVIGIDPVQIDRTGVRIHGRVETAVDIGSTPIVLFPGPPFPLLLTRAGLFVDFDKRTGGAVGGFTAVAPGVDKLVRIDATLELVADQPRFRLAGDAVLADSLNLMTTRGEVDLEKGNASFEVGTSPILSYLISARASGYARAKEADLGFQADMGVFGIRLGQGKVSLDLPACQNLDLPGHARPERHKPCFLLRADEVKLGSGVEASGSLETDLLFVNSQLDIGFQLKLFGQEFGRAGLKAALLRAVLEAQIPKLFKLTIVTPGLEVMSPRYVADIIASLLSVNLEDLLKVKLDDIVIAPAGEPGSPAASSSGDGDSGGGASDGSGGDTPPSNAPGSDEARQDGEAVPPGGKAPNAAPYPMPPQVRPHANSGTYAACRQNPQTNELSYGAVWWWVWGGEEQVYYWRELPHLSEPQFNLLCGQRWGDQGTQNKVNADTPGAFIIVPKHAPLSIRTEFSETHESRMERNLPDKGTKFPVFEVVKLVSNDESIKQRSEDIFRLEMRRTDHWQPPDSARERSECRIALNRPEAEKFADYAHDSAARVELLRLVERRWAATCKKPDQVLTEEERLTGIQIIKLEKGGWFTKPHVVAKASAELLSSGGRTKEYEAVSLMRSIGGAETVAIVTCAHVRRTKSSLSHYFYFYWGDDLPLKGCEPRVIPANDVLSKLGIEIESTEQGFQIDDSAAAMVLLNEGLPALLAKRQLSPGRKPLGDQRPACASSPLKRIVQPGEQSVWEFALSRAQSAVVEKQAVTRVEETIVQVDRFIELDPVLAEDSPWASTILNIAVCDTISPDANGWFKEREHWISYIPSDNQMTLFKPEPGARLPDGTRVGDDEVVVEVYRKDVKAPEVFRVPRFDPYGTMPLSDPLPMPTRKALLERFNQSAFDRVHLIVNRSLDEGTNGQRGGREYALFERVDGGQRKVRIEIRQGGDDDTALTGTLRVGPNGSFYGKELEFSADELETCVKPPDYPQMPTHCMI